MLRFLFSIALIMIVAYSCKRSSSAAENEKADSTIVKGDTIVSTIPALTRIWDTDTVLHTPESVLFNPANNVLYVANIGGVPSNKKDGDGFISQVSLDGKIINLRWAKGFDAPKGMAIVGNTLYVTDIDRLREVDLETGKTGKTWKVPGAKFLNDVAASADGTIYFTDSDKSAIHMLRDGNLSVVHEDISLGGTNGVFVDGNTLMLTGAQSGIVFTMNLTDKSVQKVATDIPRGDGVERYGKGWLVSNWNGEVHYIDDKGQVTEILDTQDANLNSADIEVIEEKNLLLVPTFFGNSVTAYNIKM